MNTFLPVSPTFEKNHHPPLDHRTGRSLLQPNSVADFPPGVREQQLHHQHQRGGFFFGHSSPHRVRVLINGKHKFVASTEGCVSVADFVSKKLKDIEVLRGKEVKVTLGDDFELIGSSPISILGQDECVRVKTVDRKGKEEERFYSDASGESEEEEEEEEEEETFASEEEEDWMKPRRRSDKKIGVGVSRRKKMCGRVCVNGKICKRIAGECPWHSKGKVRKERESEDGDEEDNIICAICDKGTYPKKLVLCDACDQGYHTFCYGLEKVPKGEWVCASCAIKRKKVPPRSPAVQAKNPRNEHNEKKKKKKVSSYANLLTYRTETTHSPTTSKSGVAKKKKKHIPPFPWRKGATKRCREPANTSNLSAEPCLASGSVRVQCIHTNKAFSISAQTVQRFEAAKLSPDSSDLTWYEETETESESERTTKKRLRKHRAIQ